MMASSLTTVVSVFLLALPIASSIAATLHEDGKDGRLVRRETQQLELTARAELQNGQRLVKTQPNRAVQDVDSQFLAYCDNDYLLGEPHTNNCLRPSLEQLIDIAECRFAANQSGAHLDEAAFEIDVGYYQKHPKGCFKHVCCDPDTTDCAVRNPPAHNTCFFYNLVESPLPTSGVGADGKQILGGTPVCARRRFWSGGANSAIAGGGCPDNYEVIHNESSCRSAAKCNETIPDPHFLIGVKNASQHLDHPKGCFLDHTNVGSEYFFNEPKFFVEGATTPTTVQGTPMCIVKEKLSYS